MKILIVDDEQIVLDTFLDILNWEELGVSQILTCTSGTEAYSIYQQESPDILLTDIQMPGINGIELIKKIREKDSKIHIIIFSAYSEFEYARSALQYNVTDYLLKPIHLAQFKRVIQKTISMVTPEISNEISEITSSKKAISLVKDYLNNNYKNPNLTLYYVSEYFFISYSYLSRLFKNETGMAFIDYLTRLRIEKAKIALADFNLRVSDIAKSVGYRDSGNFRRQFKAITGLTPFEYRSSLLENNNQEKVKGNSNDDD